MIVYHFKIDLVGDMRFGSHKLMVVVGEGTDRPKI